MTAAERTRRCRETFELAVASGLTMQAASRADAPPLGRGRSAARGAAQWHACARDAGNARRLVESGLMALLILIGAIDAPGSSIFALEYRPPLRAPRIAPPNLRHLSAPLDAATLAVLLGSGDPQ